MSTHFTDPINEGQIWIEVAALRYLTQGLRASSIPGISAKFQKIVHVGHSFGSSQTYALTAADPSISDGIVLTGFSQNGSFASQFILGSNFIIANTVPALSSYVTGYLAPQSAVGVQIDFFAPNSFDPQLLQVAYQNGQPVTPGEIMTLVGASARPNPVAKPVLVITGGTFATSTSILNMLIIPQNTTLPTAAVTASQPATHHSPPSQPHHGCSCPTPHPSKHSSFPAPATA